MKDDLAADLKRAASMLAVSGDPGLLRVADGIALWLEGGDGIKFEQVFGVGNNWRSALRRRRRDALYFKIGQTLFPGLTGSKLARSIIAAIDRYEASSWLGDRVTGRRPTGANALLFDILNLGERLLDLEALRKLPGIFRACEYQNQDLRFDEQEEKRLEYDDQVFEGNESG